MRANPIFSNDGGKNEKTDESIEKREENEIEGKGKEEKKKVVLVR